MATLTVGLGKTYDTVASGIAAASTTDTIEVYYTEFFDDPGVYWERVTLTAGETQTLTFFDSVWMKNHETNGDVIDSRANVGFVHTINNAKVYNFYIGQGGLYAQTAGTTNFNSCTSIATGQSGIWSGVSTGIVNIKGCFCYGGTNQGMLIYNLGAGGDITVENCTCIGVGAGILVNGTTGTFTDNNVFAYSTKVGQADYQVLTGASFGGTNYSTDGTLGSNDIGTIANASFVDWQNFDVHIKAGSGLDAVGADVGVIVDIDGNSVDTSTDPFAGCSSIAAAPSDPTTVKFLNDGDNWVIYADDPADELLKLRLVVDIGSTDYYLIERPYQNRKGMILTTDSTVLIPYRGTPISFDTSSTIISITAFWVNANNVASSGVVASQGGSAVVTPTFAGITGLETNANGLKVNWAAGSNITGYKVHLKSGSTLTAGDINADTYLVAEVNSGMTEYTFIQDKDSAFISNLEWYAAVRAINVDSGAGSSEETNTVVLGPLGGPGKNFKINVKVPQFFDTFS